MNRYMKLGTAVAIAAGISSAALAQVKHEDSLSCDFTSRGFSGAVILYRLKYIIFV